MSMSTVTWRQAVAAIVATVVALGALVFVIRADGLPAIDATSSRAVRWFVHQPTGNVVLADGFGGRALASIEVGTPDEQLTVAEGASGAYLLNDSSAEVRAIDSAELRLGSPLGLAALGTGQAIAGVAAAGLVVVNPIDDAATLLPESGESIPFDVDAASSASVAPDGSVWSINGSSLVRTTSTSRSASSIGTDTASLSLVGNQPLLLDAPNRRARFGGGDWIPLPTDADPSELVLQVQGPPNSCGWVGANDDLWCITVDGIAESATIDGLDIDGLDQLAIAGDAATLVRRLPSSIVRFDWRDGVVLQDPAATVSGDATLDIVVTVDLVWVDDRTGNFVWAVHPWGITQINKNDNSVLVLGEEGDVLEEGDAGNGDTPGADDGSGLVDEREPDDNGIDDPPVAVDDPVTARSGSPVRIPVTANDYDPDGEAITVVDTGRPGHGTVEIANASTVVYNPEQGYVGGDTFEYTIADGNGTEASAEVIIEMLPNDANNQPPVGAPDEAQTGPNRPVVVEVLLNDIDPERDPLRIGAFSPPDRLGEVTETVGPSGLPALRFDPVEGFEGTATFSYQPIDSFESLGEEVDVRVEVARVGDENRPPLVRPDAVRTRRNVPNQVPVLVNDVDPDGDLLTISVVEPLPPGIDVDVQGEQLLVVARAGSESLVPFEYEVDDGNGHQVRGGVLVAVIDDVEPNRPPVVSPDSDTAVVGRTIVLDVTANDVDPDGDPLVIVDATQPEDGRGDVAVVGRDRIEFTPAEVVDDESGNVRFTYTVSDGNGHEVTGDVTITVLPEPLPEPPYAQDDSTFTFVDEPVTIDVLRNDGDPSGERPTLVGRPGCPGGGTAVVTADDQVRFDPPRGRSGSFRCTYEVTNTQGLRASASIIVSVREPEITNEPPIAIDDTLTVEVLETARIDVTANDRDPDGEQEDLTVVSSTAPMLGSAVRNGNAIVFTAGPVEGVTTINYQVADAEGDVSLGRLSVRITEQENEPPNAISDRRTIEGPGVPQTFDVLNNDSDPDETAGGLSVVDAERVSGDGEVTRSGDVVTIIPDEDFVGDIVATYTIEDGDGLTDSAQVVLTVLEPVNRPPVAVDDSNSVANGGSVSTPVLFNDSDPDGDQLSLTITGGPDSSLGTASIASDRSIAFTATPGASGTAVINYEISDGELTDSAALRINVLACTESTPTAEEAFLSTGYEQPIAVALEDYSSNGSIVDVSAPAGYVDGVYTPPSGENGNVTINFAVVNNCRQRANGSIVIDVNQDPVAQPVTIVMGRNEIREIPVTDLASDLEPLTISGATGPPAWAVTEPGRVVLNAGGIAPGTSTWSISVTDPGGLTTSVPITVTIQNLGPTAVDDVVDASAGTTDVDLAFNDTDPDGDNGALRVQSVPTTLTFANGEVGTIELLGDQRTVRINPLAGVGIASFQYTVVDGDGAVSAAANVTVTGPAANNPPFASDQSVGVAPGAPTPVVLDAGDPDGDGLTVVELVDPSGVVTGIDGIVVTVLAPTDGVFTFTYQVDDGRDRSGVATVTITAVTPTTLPPTTTEPPPPTTEPPPPTTEPPPPTTTTTEPPPPPPPPPPPTTTTTEPPPPPPSRAPGG